MPEAQPVVCQLYQVRGDDPQVQVGKEGIGKTSEIDMACTGECFTFRLSDCAGELCATDTADTFCLEGYGAGYGVVFAELRPVPGSRVGGDDQRIVLLVPGIEARGAPRSVVADGGYAQQVMPPQE